MQCPHCRTEQLIVVEYKRVEVDYCDACGGVWLDATELELLYGNPEAAKRLLSIGEPAQAPAGEKPRRCPECDVKMTKESTSTDPAVTFDHCPNGDGLWLDKGELEQILVHSETLGGDTEITGFLRDVFCESGEGA